LINTGKVVSFIDDIIVGIEEEEGYDEVVDEVVKRLVENGLYEFANVIENTWKKNSKVINITKHSKSL